MPPLRIRPGRRVDPPKQPTSSPFGAIEFDRDEPVPRPPAPLRIDKTDREETIEQQQKGSAMRLLKDRFVDDGGYLQSRTPFPLQSPSWDNVDQDVPDLTEDGILWEDINHFIDYLTCRDVTLAYELNVRLTEKPEKVMKEFRTILETMQRPLCRHYILGRGYVFSRELVLSPSQRIGRLVLEERMDDLYKGLQYLWILDREFVEQQRNLVEGLELDRIEQTLLLLADTFQHLHRSFGWTEAHYVDVLQEFALFYPGSAPWLRIIGSPFVLANLLLEKKTMMRRLIEIRRLTESQGDSMKVLAEMGAHPWLFLRESDDVFHRFISWAPEFYAAGHNWSTSLQFCRMLFVVWKSLDLDLDTYMDRLLRLQSETPKTFNHVIEESKGSAEETWPDGHLAQMVRECDAVISKWNQLSEQHSTLIEGLPALLLIDGDSIENVTKNLDTLCHDLEDVDLYGAISIEALLKLHPEIAKDPDRCLQMYSHVHPIVMSALHSEERRQITEQCSLIELVGAVTKLESVIETLQGGPAPMKHARIQELIRQKTELMRRWQRNGTIPKEIVAVLNALSVADLTETILLADEKWREKEKSLFLLFGPLPASVLNNLARMPELLMHEGVLERAIAVSRCRKIGRKDLRNPDFRIADNHMSLLMSTLELVRRRPGINQDEVLTVLEKVTRVQLLKNTDNEIDPLALSQFCILCVEHPAAWDQYKARMRPVIHPVLKVMRPEEVQKMMHEAFGFILKAPEVFLIPDLWNQIVENMSREQWTFAGLDIDTVLKSEPCLFYCAVQDQWVKKYERNAQKLIDIPDDQRIVRRRGKSVVGIQVVAP